MSRRADKPTARPHAPSATSSAAPPLWGLVLGLLLAFALSAVALSRVWSSTGFLQMQLARASFWGRPGASDAVGRVLRSTPISGATSEAVEALQSLERIMTDAATGRGFTEADLPDADNLARRDADNGLSQFYAGCLRIAVETRGAGVDAAAGAATLQAVAARVNAARRCTTYEGALQAQYRSALSRFAKRPDLAILLAPREIDLSQYAALPAAVDGLLRRARAWHAAGNADAALAALRLSTRVLMGLLQDDPAPPAALLCADLLARVGETGKALSAATPAASQPPPAVLTSAIDWWAISDDARRLASDVRSARRAGPIDALDQHWLPGGAAYVRCLTMLWLTHVLAALSIVIGGGCVLRAAWLALRPADGSATDRLSWLRGTLASAATLAPPLFLSGVVQSRLSAGRIGATEGMAALLAMLAAILSGLLAGHGAVGAPATALSLADAPRRRTQWHWIIAGGLLGLTALLPLSVIARLPHDWATRPAAVVAAGLLVPALAVALIVIMPRVLRSRCGPPRARMVLLGGMQAAVFAAALAQFAVSMHTRADGALAAAVVRDTDRVAPLAGEEWQARFFIAAFRAAELATRP